MKGKSESDRTILFKLDLTGCPEGRVMDVRNPDRSVDEKYFKNVETPLSPERVQRRWGSTFRVLTDADAKRVLEHWSKRERCLLTGHRFWSDYVVEVKMRKLMASNLPDFDDEHCMVSRSGIVFRQKTVRRYYFYCIEGLDKIVLYRREDDRWTPLEVERLAFDKNRYYWLKVECFGKRIRCYLDGSKVFEVTDDTFKTGKAGIRMNTVTRVYDWKVYTTQQGFQMSWKTLKTYEVEVAKASSKYPKPILWKTLDLSRFTRSSLTPFKFGRFSGAEEQILVLEDQVAPAKLCLVNLEGEVMWENEYPDIRGPASSWNVKVSDMDGDGLDEVAIISRRDKIAIIDGSSGKILSLADVPKWSAFAGSYEGSPCGGNIYICNLDGHSLPRDIIVFDGGVPALWAYDENLKPLWRVRLVLEAGHHVNFWDVDGDGWEEILIGYNLVDHDGAVIWEVEGAESFDSSYMSGRHADCVALGEFDGDPETVEAALASGSDGFLLVDGKTGKIRRRHRIGHAQCLSVGKYRTDLQGLQFWVGNRWGSYGTLNLFSGSGDRLYTFQPDNISQGGVPVNWSGDGEELLLLWSSKKALGLYDAYGRRVVSLPEEIISLYDKGFARSNPPSPPSAYAYDVVGDKRDELIFWSNGLMYILAQDRSYPEGKEIYAPIRTIRRFGHPTISLPNWEINEIR